LYKVVQSSRLFEQIVQQIEASILRGELVEGSQLPPERDLAKKFGVSRTAVREAIKALQEKGLVDAFPGRGTFVTNGRSNSLRRSLDEIARSDDPEGRAHLLGFREIVEPEIAAWAALLANKEETAALREAYQAMNQALRDPEAYVEADLDFHLTLAEAAGNPIVLSLIDSIVGMLREQRLQIFEVEGGPQRGQMYHEQILEAVEKRLPDRARAAMKAHLKQVREDLKSARHPQTPRA